MKFRLRDGSGVMKLRYLVEDMDRHGNVRVYVRKNGRKTRIRETPGTDAFMAAYKAALNETPLPDKARGPNILPSSFRWLLTQYFASAEFMQLGPRTRHVRRSILEHIAGERFEQEPIHGDKRFANMEPRHVRRIRDVKADLPGAANSRVKALRQLFAWAVDYEIAQQNPAREVPYLKSRNPDGFHTWTTEEVQKFEAAHPPGTKAHLALYLMLFTGVRRSDVVKLGRQMEFDDGQWLRFSETKGRSRILKNRELPILPPLRQAIDACGSGNLTYLVTAFDKPFTANGFGNWFRKRCNEAGLLHCTAHGLRKAGATIAANNGATEHQLMAIFGWESPKQAALYTRKANRKRLAGEAMHLISVEQKMDKSVPLSEPVRSGGTKRAKKPN